MSKYKVNQIEKQIEYAANAQLFVLKAIGEIKKLKLSELTDSIETLQMIHDSTLPYVQEDLRIELEYMVSDS